MGLFGKHQNTLEVDVDELEHQLTCTQERSDFFLKTISSLFFYIKGFSLDLIDIDSHIFKYQMDEINKYYNNEDEIKIISKEFDESKLTIENFIHKEKIYLNDRDNEYKNIIEILTSGIYDIGSENKEFANKMYQSNEVIDHIRQLNDIKQIKQELEKEVARVKQCIKDKQEQDCSSARDRSFRRGVSVQVKCPVSTRLRHQLYRNIPK